MSLTRKDIINSFFALIVLSIYIARMQQVAIPIISGDYRWAILFMGVLGIMMCAQGANPKDFGKETPKSLWIKMLSGLGIVALVCIILGLIVGTKLFFQLITLTILSMWVLTTGKRILTPKKDRDH